MNTRLFVPSLSVDFLLQTLICWTAVAGEPRCFVNLNGPTYWSHARNCGWLKRSRCRMICCSCRCHRRRTPACTRPRTPSGIPSSWEPPSWNPSPGSRSQARRQQLKTQILNKSVGQESKSCLRRMEHSEKIVSRHFSLSLGFWWEFQL